MRTRSALGQGNGGCRRAAGKPLIENAEIEKIADVLFDAPFALLSHNRFAPGVQDEEAVFTYANQACSWLCHACLTIDAIAPIRSV